MLLTIAIPTYNRIDLLKRCLESIRNQIGSDDSWVEVLVVDNDSPDGTYLFLESIKTPVLRIIKNSVNIGAENNILKVTSEAKGKYVFWLSDDDVLLDGVIEYLKEFLTKTPESVGWIISPLPTYDYVTGNLTCNVHPSSNHYKEIKPSYCSVIKYAGYGWAFSRQIFARKLIDESFLRGNSGNMYFILSIPTQMLMQYHSIYLPKPFVKHTYGNQEFWEEFGHDIKLRRAKAALDFAIIVPQVINYLAELSIVNRLKALFISAIWISQSAKDWNRNNRFQKVYEKLSFLLQQSKVSNRVVFFSYFLLNILLWMPYELSVLVIRSGLSKLYLLCKR